jgi:hypothetical protein
MKKIIFTIAIGLTLASCTNDAISKSHEGVDFEVEFLFEKDGIKLYRFYDNGYHYYTNRGETITTQKEGKNNYYQENIQ